MELDSPEEFEIQLQLLPTVQEAMNGALWFQIQAPLLTSCMTLGKLLSISGLSFLICRRGTLVPVSLRLLP